MPDKAPLQPPLQQLAIRPLQKRDLVLWAAFLGVSTATQLAFKLASKPLENLDFGLTWIKVAGGSPMFAGAVVMYLVAFGLWIMILQRRPLSQAFLLTALVFVTVTLGSAVWLGEHITPAQVGGIALIITGIALLGVGGPLGQR